MIMKNPLPVPKKIEIRNYDLYKCPLSIEFSKGLNIVFGTNGLGKSTFLYILQYSIIGPYIDGIKTRNYKGTQTTRRPIYDEGFFRQRMKDQNEKAQVKIGYVLGKRKFVVTHSLYDLRLLKVSIDGEQLEGELIDYSKYEDWYFSKKKSDKDLTQTLIHKYHQALVEAANLPDIEALITMMTKCMFFSEDRDFTFWSDDLSNTIISKYFMDQEGYKKFVEEQQNEKKFDSQERLKTYEISFIRKFLGENAKNSTDRNSKFNFSDLTQIQEEIEIIEKTIKKLETQISSLDRDRLETRIKIEKTRNYITSLDASWYKAIFPEPYQNAFNRYSRSLLEGNCPFCGSKGDYNIKASECFYCGSKINVTYKANLSDIELEKKDSENELRIAEKNAIRIQNKTITLQKELNSYNKKYDVLKKDELSIKDSLKKSDTTDEYYQKLNELEKEKEVLRKKRDDTHKRAQRMLKALDDKLHGSFLDYAKVFNKYAAAFFGTPYTTKLELIGDEGVTLFRFSLNGTRRETSKALSESQRIFVDLSYRLSILDYFHDSSYFICETPDSTLDVYSEERAEKTFTNFINSGNTLFLSANARTSTLIKRLIENNLNNFNLIDLFKISTASPADMSEQEATEVIGLSTILGLGAKNG